MHFPLLPNYTYTCLPSGKENPMKRTCLNGVFGEWEDGSFIPDLDQDQYCKAFNLPLSQSSERQVDSQQFVYSGSTKGKSGKFVELQILFQHLLSRPFPTPFLYRGEICKCEQLQMERNGSEQQTPYATLTVLCQGLQTSLSQGSPDSSTFRKNLALRKQPSSAVNVIEEAISTLKVFQLQEAELFGNPSQQETIRLLATPCQENAVSLPIPLSP